MRYFVVILAVFMMISSSFAEISFYYPAFTSFRIPVNDMRSKAMGSSEILTTSGSNSLFTNPALYSKNQYSCFSVTGLFDVNSSDKYRPEANLSSYIYEVNFSNDYPLMKNFKSFSFSKGIDLGNSSRLAFALGYQVAHDLSIKRSYEGEYWETSSHHIRDKSKTEVEGDLTTWCPSMSFTLWDCVSIGYTIEYSLFDTFTEDYWYHSDHYTTSDDYSYSSYGRRLYEGNLSGSCSTFGGVLDFKRIIMGFKYRTKFDYDYEDISYRWIYDDEYSGTSEMENSTMMIPASYGVSISAQLSKGFILVGEYQIHKYSEMKEYFDNSLLYDFNDGDVKRFGFEAGLLDLVFLRGGIFSESAFLFNGGKDPQQLEGLTGGIGFRNGAYKLDFGIEYYRYEYELLLTPDKLHEIEGSNLNIGITISIISSLI